MAAVAPAAAGWENPMDQEAASIKDQNEDRADGSGDPQRSQTAFWVVEKPHHGHANWPEEAEPAESTASIQSGGRSIMVPVPGTGTADQSWPVWKKSSF